ncbi:hypothetical protein N8J89_17595 [Crossiella sp. CA-258035]|nr:hypothetical protein [Crossiella sp. CA-258035]WHT22805.1 hypothetical protein N8J89_17595 [Crossiella sp. CA-258035]
MTAQHTVTRAGKVRIQLSRTRARILEGSGAWPPRVEEDVLTG